MHIMCVYTFFLLQHINIYFHTASNGTAHSGVACNYIFELAFAFTGKRHHLPDAAKAKAQGMEKAIPVYACPS